MTDAKPALASDGTPHPSPIPDLESVQAAHRAHHRSSWPTCHVQARPAKRVPAGEGIGARGSGVRVEQCSSAPG